MLPLRGMELILADVPWKWGAMFSAQLPFFRTFDSEISVAVGYILNGTLSQGCIEHMAMHDYMFAVQSNLL